MKPKKIVGTRAVIILVTTIPALILLGQVWWVTALDWPEKFRALVAGLFCALALTKSADWLKAKFSVPGLSTGGSASLFFPIALDLHRDTARGPLAENLKAVYEQQPASWIKKLKELFGNIGQFVVRVLRPFGGEDYFIEDPHNHSVHFRGGHSYAVFLFAGAALIYSAIGLFERVLLLGNDVPWWFRFAVGVPPLAYILFTLALACLFFSGVSFFFDKYRVPTLTLFVLFSLGTSFAAPESDHFFRVRTGTAPHRGETPANILARHKTTPILIAAEGGGIQSAAWTAEVVSRLERDLRKDFPDFKERIALISGVSGGAVGAMHLGGVLVQIGTPK